MGTIESWTDQLGRSPVFGALSLDMRRSLAGSGTMIRLAHGARLFSAGDPGDAAYLVLSGELEVGLSRADGRETWLARLRPGAVIGDMAVLDGGNRSADATATRTSQLLRLGRDTLMAALAAEPQAALRLLGLLVERLRSVNGLVEAASVLGVGARLARLLLAGDRRDTRSQSDLAKVISATRESVNRKLSAWRAAGWVDIDPSGIEVRDRAALCREAQFDELDDLGRGGKAESLSATAASRRTA